VFLTAAHCTAFLEGEGISQVWVTFAPAYDEDSTSLAGLVAGSRYVGNPQFGSGGAGRIRCSLTASAATHCRAR
jgi:hypothetical protein